MHDLFQNFSICHYCFYYRIGNQQKDVCFAPHNSEEVCRIYQLTADKIIPISYKSSSKVKGQCSDLGISEKLGNQPTIANNDATTIQERKQLPTQTIGMNSTMNGKSANQSAIANDDIRTIQQCEIILSTQLTGVNEEGANHFRQMLQEVKETLLQEEKETLLPSEHDDGASNSTVNREKGFKKSNINNNFTANEKKTRKAKKILIIRIHIHLQ